MTADDRTPDPDVTAVDDLLELMKPGDLTPEAEDAWRAGVGDGAVVVVESHADYASYPDSVANEQGVSLKTGQPRTVTTKLERGLKDVVITLPYEDRDRLLELIRRLRSTGQWASTADVICDAVLHLADRVLPDHQAEAAT